MMTIYMYYRKTAYDKITLV